MKANNLSVSIPNRGCTKDCPYCVSKMTGYMTANVNLFMRNLDKAKHLAEMSQVSSVSITGKGEPLLNFKMVREVVKVFVDFPVELQTGGLELADNTSLVDLLAIDGVDIFALSFDKWTDFEDMKYVIERINHMDRTVRVTMNVSDMLPPINEAGFTDYIDMCIKHYVDQFSFRRLSIPERPERIAYLADFIEGKTNIRGKAVGWIQKHAPYIGEHRCNVLYDDLIEQFDKIQYNTYKYGLIRNLNYGAKLYDVNGVSFTYFDYCIQDYSNNSEDIRSLIYQEDGHMYTTWNSLASRIF